jgi:signal transduction histidine kinase
VRRNKLFRSSTFRLALIYMVLFSASVLALLGFIYWSTAGYMSRQADETIRAEIKGLAERYETDGLGGLTAQLADRLTAQQPGDSSIYLLTDSQLNPMVGNIDRWPRVRENEQGWINFELSGSNTKRIHRARARAFILKRHFHLLVGRDISELEDSQKLIIRTLIWGMAITLALALLGGVMMSRSMMRRIELINRTSREIMSGDLTKRIPTSQSGDDFDALADNLNRMLDQIELLMDGVRRVSDNIAHDLRTPLARLRRGLESVRMSDAQGKSRRELVDNAVNEVDGLLATFNALLRIARIESEARREGFDQIQFSPLLRDVGDLYGPVAEEKGLEFKLVCESSMTLYGDRDLLVQSLANILDNAIKYTPAGGSITMRVDDRLRRVIICDTGPGIPESERDKVFQRFYRLDRSRTSAGSGLGLSLASAVAKLHGIELTLGSNDPGLCVTLQMPA